MRSLVGHVHIQWPRIKGDAEGIADGIISQHQINDSKDLFVEMIYYDRWASLCGDAL